MSNPDCSNCENCASYLGWLPNELIDYLVKVMDRNRPRLKFNIDVDAGDYPRCFFTIKIQEELTNICATNHFCIEFTEEVDEYPQGTVMIMWNEYDPSSASDNYDTVSTYSPHEFDLLLEQISDIDSSFQVGKIVYSHNEYSRNNIPCFSFGNVKIKINESNIGLFNAFRTELYENLTEYYNRLGNNKRQKV